MDEAYKGTSFESFEDAVANALADVPGNMQPRTFDVTLRYSVGGITPPRFEALLQEA